MATTLESDRLLRSRLLLLAKTSPDENNPQWADGAVDELMQLINDHTATEVRKAFDRGMETQKDVIAKAVENGDITIVVNDKEIIKEMNDEQN